LQFDLKGFTLLGQRDAGFEIAGFFEEQVHCTIRSTAASDWAAVFFEPGFATTADG
jgi:hypothetical protein